MINSPFTQLKLSNGVRCDIFEIRAGHVMRAVFESTVDKSKGELKTDISPYLIRQICLFDNKQPTIEEVENLMIDDWIKISEVIQAQNNKISDLYK